MDCGKQYSGPLFDEETYPQTRGGSFQYLAFILPTLMLEKKTEKKVMDIILVRVMMPLKLAFGKISRLDHKEKEISCIVEMMEKLLVCLLADRYTHVQVVNTTYELSLK